MKDAQSIVRLADYKPSDYLIETTELRFELTDSGVKVTTTLHAQRNPAAAGSRDWVLDGEALDLLSIAVDGEPLSMNQYTVDSQSLTLIAPPERFTLETVVAIDPQNNTVLEGLYRSGSLFCTQCEAEGFRRITYYADRPDVLSKFTTTIVAEEKYPTLLSNGNLRSSRQLEDGRTEVVWDDPFPKPCYLFALVAGNLRSLEDRFVTTSGREVDLRIYTEPRNADKLDFAMDSLRRAMRWDEEVYGREYDLDVFMIVAVDDFNAGAMENKGLNIFNASCLLAHPRTTTDAGFQRVEGVVAHEYFHNWSGNRVTCRDWFQLSLKEGFTVFRDAEFSADMGSRTAKRIQDVSYLRSFQFMEDAGPMAHSVQPSSYLAIENFYTLTVYEKGSELVRMMHRLLGADRFRKGCDLYFSRHDGAAVTIEEFVAAMEDASGIDLRHFRRWYSQSGTPDLLVEDEWRPESGEYLIRVRQHTAPTADQEDKEPLHIPLVMGLLDTNGEDLLRRSGAVAVNAETLCEPGDRDGDLVVHLRRESEEVRFEGLRDRPVASLLRGFSAPVKLEFARDEQDLRFLIVHDRDGFSRWDAAQGLATQALVSRVEGEDDKAEALEEQWLQACVEVARDALDALDDGEQKAIFTELLKLPTQQSLVARMCPAPALEIHRAHLALRRKLAGHGQEVFLELYQRNAPQGSYKPDGPGIARRMLKNLALSYLMLADPEAIAELCESQFASADNMTDRQAAMLSLAHSQTESLAERRRACLAAFEEEFRDEALAMDLWFSAQATAPDIDVLETVKELTRHSAFDSDNPNRNRALFGAWSMGNLLGFHREDNQGYAYLADQVIRLDKGNPRMAARMLTPLMSWRRQDRQHGLWMRGQLARIQSACESVDVSEMVSKALREE